MSIYFEIILKNFNKLNFNIQLNKSTIKNEL